MKVTALKENLHRPLTVMVLMGPGRSITSYISALMMLMANCWSMVADAV